MFDHRPTKARGSIRHLLKIIGSLLGLIGVLFVGQRLYSYAGQIDLSYFDFTAYSIIGLLSIFYAALNILLARAWWQILLFFDVEVDWKWAVKTYGLSQLAKYVPGNIFHLAGRQTLGMSAGVGAIQLAKSTIWELGLMAVCGTLFGFLALPMVWPRWTILVSIALFVSISTVLFILLQILFSGSIFFAAALQMIFLAMSSVVFIGTLSIASQSSALIPALPALCGAYVIAWLAGLITPGAPAGVGVRELVLLFLLGSQISQADLLLAVVLGRIVTVLGDLLFFIASFILKDNFFPIGTGNSA